MTEQKTSLNKNAIYNTIKNTFNILFPLISFPYITRVLGTDNVGKINFGTSVISYFILFASLGVNTYAIRECSIVKNDHKELGRISSEIFSINFISMMISYFLLILLILFWPKTYGYRTIICIQSITIAGNTLGADWLNTAMEDFKYITIRTIVFQLISLILMFLFVHKAEDYIKYVVIVAIASNGANIVNFFYRRKYCSTRLTRNLAFRVHLPAIMLLFSTILMQTIFVNSDMTILGIYKGDHEVGLYSVSVKIYSMVNTVIASVAWVMLPQLSKAFKEKDYKEINELLEYSLNFIIILGLPAIVAMNVMADGLVYAVAGKEYLGATLSLHLLSVSLFFSLIGGLLANMILLPSGRETIMLVGSIISATANLILNFLLIPKCGLNAAAFTTALSNLIGVIFSIPFIDKEISLKGIIRMLIAPIVGSAAIALVAWGIRLALDINVASTVLFVVLGGIVYFLVLYLFKDRFFMNYLNMFIQRVRGLVIENRE